VHMKMKAIQKEIRIGTDKRKDAFPPVLSNINAQIKILRSMMTDINTKDEHSNNDKIMLMRSSILDGSVYPLDSAKNASRFFSSYS
jgi:hypothetical protein